jgi:hypothetical protein
MIANEDTGREERKEPLYAELLDEDGLRLADVEKKADQLEEEASEKKSESWHTFQTPWDQSGSPLRVG